jgi:hypothetical protein
MVRLAGAAMIQVAFSIDRSWQTGKQRQEKKRKEKKRIGADGSYAIGVSL